MKRSSVKPVKNKVQKDQILNKVWSRFGFEDEVRTQVIDQVDNNFLDRVKNQIVKQVWDKLRDIG